MREVGFFPRTSKMILSQTRTKISLSVLPATLINFTLTFVMALTLGHRLASYQSKTETVSLTLEQHLDNKSAALSGILVSSKKFFLLPFTDLQ